MTPIPHKSPFCDKIHYLIKTLKGFGIVPNGIQPTQALTFLTMKDAKTWLKDNGFNKT